MQWEQDRNQNNVANPNNVRREARRHFREKKKKYLKAKIQHLETNSNIKKIGTCIRASVTLRSVTGLELI